MSTVQLKTRDHQRKEHYARLVLSFRLELQLRDMVRLAIKGNVSALNDFQRMIHYAPDEMKFRMIDYISKAQSV